MAPILPLINFDNKMAAAIYTNSHPTSTTIQTIFAPATTSNNSLWIFDNPKTQMIVIK